MKDLKGFFAKLERVKHEQIEINDRLLTGLQKSLLKNTRLVMLLCLMLVKL